jgi:hypothetical protein
MKDLHEPVASATDETPHHSTRSRRAALSAWMMASALAFAGIAEAAPPDITFQAAACLVAGSDELVELQTDLQTIVQQAQTSRPDLFSNPSSQTGCIGGRETIGIWLAADSAPADLAGVDILTSRGALMAVQMNSVTAKSLVATEWSRYQADNPHPGYDYGGFDIAYDDQKKTVKTTFHAHKLGVQVTIDLVDTLAVTSDGFPSCSTITTFHKDANLVEALIGFLVPIPIDGGLDLSVEGLLFGAEESFYTASNDAISGSGLGCAFAALIPTTILTPANAAASPPKTPGKLVFAFRQLSLSPTDGMTFFTQNPADVPTSIQPRNPMVLAAPFLTYVYASGTSAAHISSRLSVTLRDLRPDAGRPIHITWSAQSGKIVSVADGGTYALATFGAIPAAQRHVGGRTKLGSVTVTATDADNVSASATFPVFAQVENDPAGPPPKNVGKPTMR